MKRVFIFASVLAAITLAAAQTKTSEPKRIVNIEYGRYLVNNVAQCVQCHTPRNERGELIRSQLLEGAPIPVGKPNQPGAWAEFAPRIAGIPQYTEQQIIALLTTGTGREGKTLRSPMPTFKMSWQDAADVAAYLKSLR